MKKKAWEWEYPLEYGERCTPSGWEEGGLKSRDLETGQTGGTGEKLGYLPYHLAGDGSRITGSKENPWVTEACGVEEAGHGR